MRSRCVVSIIASLLVYGLCNIAGVASALDPFRALPPGQQIPAPAFSLPDHQGTQVHSADLQGKVVVVRFWATW
jgi:cytochrome oxidase Cu insertion factor (SCO1/SenC/PrrC family)